jgi:acetyl esterase/lipase
MKHIIVLTSILCLYLTIGFGADPASPAPPRTNAPAKPVATQRAPTLANVAYGAHERQVLDFYRAASDKPTPLVFHIHGGGWVWGDK